MQLLIAGDYCEKLRVSESVASRKYEEMFGNVKSIVSSADYSIVNFEFPIVQNIAAPIKKMGPNLKGSIGSVEAVKYAGFKCCTLANNHILDQGDDCALETKRLLIAAGIDCVGLGKNAEDASTILYKKVGDDTLAIINCCEHEFSVSTSDSPGANALNPVSQYYSIREAKDKADYVVVIVHGGHEHFQLPSIRMQDTYRYFIDCGADCVVNHHQHCYSGFECYNGKPIFYGLGNFLFDRKGVKDSPWNEGFMLLLDLQKGQIKYELIPYDQCNDVVTVKPKEEHERVSFFHNIERLNAIIEDRNVLNRELQQYYESCSNDEIRLLTCYKGSFLGKLFSKGVLPWMLSFRLVPILNHVRCESHREKFLYALKRRMQK